MNYSNLPLMANYLYFSVEMLFTAVWYSAPHPPIPWDGAKREPGPDIELRSQIGGTVL